MLSLLQTLPCYYGLFMCGWVVRGGLPTAFFDLTTPPKLLFGLLSMSRNNGVSCTVYSYPSDFRGFRGSYVSRNFRTLCIRKILMVCTTRSFKIIEKSRSKYFDRSELRLHFERTTIN